LATSTCNLGHQRAGGVEHLQAALLGLAPDRLRHAVGAEYQRAAGRHLVQFLDEHRALCAQVIDHELAYTTPPNSLRVNEL